MGQTASDEDLKAANDFRDWLIAYRVDKWDGPAPMWYGWAVFDAFLAGQRPERLCAKSNDVGAVRSESPFDEYLCPLRFREPARTRGRRLHGLRRLRLRRSRLTYRPAGTVCRIPGTPISTCCTTPCGFRFCGSP